MKVWMVRAGRQGEDEGSALEAGFAIIKFRELSDLSTVKSREEMLSLFRKTFPHDSKYRLGNFAGQMWTFGHRIEQGDIIALPLKSAPRIALGRVTGPYKFQNVRGESRHTIPVNWIRPDVSRSEFGQDLLFSLGAIMTLCRIERNNAEARFEALINGQKDPGYQSPTKLKEANEESESSVSSVDVQQLVQDQIMKYIEQHFKGHDLARLVDAVLNAEGYITKVSPSGPDGGVDILAAKGMLGMEEPRLCVQVKSQQSPADVTVFRTLQGTMQTFQADQGLLVCWGGFNKVVLQEARQRFFSVRLWDSKDLMEAVYRDYDRFPEELQAELPLKRIWALVLEE